MILAIEQDLENVSVNSKYPDLLSIIIYIKFIDVSDFISNKTKLLRLYFTYVIPNDTQAINCFFAFCVENNKSQNVLKAKNVFLL